MGGAGRAGSTGPPWVWRGFLESGARWPGGDAWTEAASGGPRPGGRGTAAVWGSRAALAAAAGREPRS